MNDKIRTDTDILYGFLDKFWFAPSDGLLRAIETNLWNLYSFKNKKVLAIGIGDGRYDSLIFRKQKKIDVGIDNDVNSINLARQNKLYKKVCLESAEHLSFKSNSFDLVISNSTFEHIKNDQKAIYESSRVLKKGGKLIFSVPTDNLEKIFKKIGITKKEIKWFNQRVFHFHYRNLEEWKKILYKNGLKINKYYFYMDMKLLKTWWSLFKISVFRPYHRELWSYLKDSPYGKLAPKKLITRLLYLYLRNKYKKAFNSNGVWLFIEAEKK